MPEDLRTQIEKSLEEIGEVDYRRCSHHGAGPVKPRVLPPEDLVHTKTETIRKCSNPKCEEPIRNDKSDTHILKATNDLFLQEAAEDVLERSQNFAPDGQPQEDTKEIRM